MKICFENRAFKLLNLGENLVLKSLNLSKNLAKITFLRLFKKFWQILVSNLTFLKAFKFIKFKLNLMRNFSRNFGFKFLVKSAFLNAFKFMKFKLNLTFLKAFKFDKFKLNFSNFAFKFRLNLARNFIKNLALNLNKNFINFGEDFNHFKKDFA